MYKRVPLVNCCVMSLMMKHPAKIQILCIGHCQMTMRHQNKLPEFSDVLFWWTDHSVCYQFPFWPCMFVYLQIDLLWFKYPENNRSNLIKLADTWRKSLIKCCFFWKNVGRYLIGILPKYSTKFQIDHRCRYINTQ